MLNEQRVKQMVKLAFYESGKGSEEIKISSCSRKSYINRNTWLSVLWVTVAYVALLCFLGWGLLGTVIGNLTTMQLISMLILLSGIYAMILVLCVIKARQYYKNKHARAYFHVKKFKQDLAELDRMYDKEDSNGEII